MLTEQIENRKETTMQEKKWGKTDIGVHTHRKASCDETCWLNYQFKETIKSSQCGMQVCTGLCQANWAGTILIQQPTVDCTPHSLSAYPSVHLTTSNNQTHTHTYVHTSHSINRLLPNLISGFKVSVEGCVSREPVVIMQPDFTALRNITTA